MQFITNKLDGMNIISNCCLGAYTYQRMNMPYNNPFMWSIMRYDDIASIIQNWANIKWNNIDLSSADTLGPEYYPSEFPLNERYRTRTYYITIDHQITVWYVHYLNSTRHAVPTRVNGIDIAYNKIWEYVVEKYRERVGRMILQTTHPIFYLMKTRHLTIEDMAKLDKLCAVYGYKCIIAHNKVNGNLSADNIIDVHTDDIKLCASEACNRFAKIALNN